MVNKILLQNFFLIQIIINFNAIINKIRIKMLILKIMYFILNFKQYSEKIFFTKIFRFRPKSNKIRLINHINKKYFLQKFFRFRPQIIKNFNAIINKIRIKILILQE